MKALKKKVNYEKNFNTPQILTKETYIKRRFLMVKSKIRLVIVMLTIKDSSNFNKGIVDYDGILNGRSKISLVIVMLTTKESSNFNRGNVNYDGILNGKKQD